MNGTHQVISFGRTNLEGRVKGREKIRRTEKEVEDNIREWSGLGFPKSQRAVKNGEEWWKMAVKLSVQWSSGLEFPKSQRAVTNREEWRKMAVKSSVQW